MSVIPLKPRSMGTLGTAQIKVTPDVLLAKSGQVKSKIDLMKKSMMELETCMQNTSSYWQGEAGDMYRSKYREFKDNTDEMTNRLLEHVRDLNTMAGVYEEAEKDIQTAIESLPSDIIV